MGNIKNNLVFVPLKFSFCWLVFSKFEILQKTNNFTYQSLMTFSVTILKLGLKKYEVILMPKIYFSH